MPKTKKFRLDSLFESENGDFDIQQKHINGKGYYVLSSGIQNLGIIGKTDIQARIFSANTLTVDMFGNVYYRNFEYKMVTHARIFSLKYKLKAINDRIGLYLCSKLKFLSKIFSYSNMASWNKIKSMEITLPIDAFQEIDYEYIEKYISELEEERISELSAYLEASGLNDYKLTKEEKEVLNKKQEYKEYKIIDIFDVKNTHSILKGNIKYNSGSMPYVTASENNNAVATYISYDKSLSERGNSILIGGKTLVITYQSDDFFSNDSHNLALYLKDYNEADELVQLFLVTVLYKSLKPMYTWGDSISKTKIKNNCVLLPTTHSKIDYDYMRLYMSAIRKMVISDVIKYKDLIISSTKKCI